MLFAPTGAGLLLILLGHLHVVVQAIPWHSLRVEGQPCDQNAECASGFCSHVTGDYHVCAGARLCEPLAPRDAPGNLWIQSYGLDHILSGHVEVNSLDDDFHLINGVYLWNNVGCLDDLPAVDDRPDVGRGCNWAISDAGDGKVFISTRYSTNIRKHETWTVRLQAQEGSVESLVIREGDEETNDESEKWTISDAGDGFVFITSYFGEQLAGPFAGVTPDRFQGDYAGVTPDFGNLEKWRIRTRDNRPWCGPEPPRRTCSSEYRDGGSTCEAGTAYSLTNRDSTDLSLCCQAGEKSDCFGFEYVDDTPDGEGCAATPTFRRLHADIGHGCCRLFDLDSCQEHMGWDACMWNGNHNDLRPSVHHGNPSSPPSPPSENVEITPCGSWYVGGRSPTEFFNSMESLDRIMICLAATDFDVCVPFYARDSYFFGGDNIWCYSWWSEGLQVPAQQFAGTGFAWIHDSCVSLFGEAICSRPMTANHWQFWAMQYLPPTYVRTGDVWEWKRPLHFGATDEIPRGQGSADESSDTFESLIETLPLIITIATVGICLGLVGLVYLVLSRKLDASSWPACGACRKREPTYDHYSQYQDGRRKTRALPSDMVLV